MAQFSSSERKIALILSKIPWLKNMVKACYQYASYFIYKKKDKVYLHPDVKLEKIMPLRHTFWGYYDKSPENNGHYLLHGYKSEVNPHTCAEIDILLDGNIVGTTNTWNWQQGSMMSWLNKNEFIYNFYDSGQFKSCITNITDSSKKIISYPIYSVGKDGKYALTLNFSRLAKLRPDYGYFNKGYDAIHLPDSEDGIFYVDFENNSEELVVSIEQLKKFYHREEMDNAGHKVNHIDISPNNKRFIFIHRWFNSQGRKWSRLISADINGENMYLLSDDELVSHCTWRNNTEIVGWMRRKGIGDRYFLLKDKSPDFEIVGDGVLTEDGHPGFSKDGQWMLTDTYPDKSRLSSLLLYNMQSKKLYRLGKFFSALRYKGEMRCDLHPRYNNLSNSEITFDSVHEGIRNAYKLNIEKITSNQA